MRELGKQRKKEEISAGLFQSHPANNALTQSSAPVMTSFFLKPNSSSSCLSKSSSALALLLRPLVTAA